MTDANSETREAGRVVVVFGSTGTAGEGAIMACLADARISEVRAVTRRPLALSDPKLTEVHCEDYLDLGAIEDALKEVDACLYCLGTSVRNVSGEDQYREIHEAYPMAAAEALIRLSPQVGFVYLSGAGAHRNARSMWARVKAEAEDSLGDVGLSRLSVARPAFIQASFPTGPGKWLLGPLLGLHPAIGINAAELGHAMLADGLDNSWSGVRLHNNASLRKAAGV